jgi:guanylate kinase
MAGTLFVVSGPSGCGKTTLCEKLLKQSLGLVRSVSVTTRKARDGERHKRDYIYTDTADFKRRLSKNEFLEHAEVFGSYYGTPKRFIDRTLKRGKDVLLNIDIQGAAQIRQRTKDAVLIFIMPPSITELRKRLVGRLTDTRPQILKRLKIARREMKAIKRYDYYVINDNLREAVGILRHIIIASRHRVL